MSMRHRSTGGGGGGGRAEGARRTAVDDDHDHDHDHDDNNKKKEADATTTGCRLAKDISRQQQQLLHQRRPQGLPQHHKQPPPLPAQQQQPQQRQRIFDSRPGSTSSTSSSWWQWQWWEDLLDRHLHHGKDHYKDNENENDDGLVYIFILIVIVLSLIVFGILVLFQLMDSKGLLPPFLQMFLLIPSSSSSSSSSSSLLLQNTPTQDDDNGGGLKVFPPLPSSNVYTIPHSMEHIGDRSDAYAMLRKEFDRLYPYDPQRSLQAMQEFRPFHHHHHHHHDNDNKRTLKTFLSSTTQNHYDIYNCPDEPPENYPFEWRTLELLRHWNPNDRNVPDTIYQSLCVFDYYQDYVKAMRYRNLEKPFVLTGDPQVARTVERWNHPDYIELLMNLRPNDDEDEILKHQYRYYTSSTKSKAQEHRAEYSDTNHFMFWMPAEAKRQSPNAPGRVVEADLSSSSIPQGWEPPTQMLRMTYSDWLQKANVTDADESLLAPHQPHWYFRLVGCGETGPWGTCDAGSSEWLFDELTFFQPRPDNSLYLTDPYKQRGIHCRFGMPGITIANHFDANRNAVVILRGERRYILSHPKSCSAFALYPAGHPSARHSRINWTLPDLDAHPEFAELAHSNEVVLQAGDVLYLPTRWFHYIVSLSLSYQCNTRSGTTDAYQPFIKKCGF